MFTDLGMTKLGIIEVGISIGKDRQLLINYWKPYYGVKGKLCN